MSPRIAELDRALLEANAIIRDMHPWLLPSPLLAMLSRRLVLGTRDVAPKDLLEASFVEQLSEEERSAVVATALDRISRNGFYMASLRGKALGGEFELSGRGALERLTPQTQRALTLASRHLPIGELNAVRWGQVLTQRGLSRRDLMVALAEVEWRHQHAQAQADQGPDVRVKITELLRDVRIDEILDTDLRYSWRHLQGQGSLVKFLNDLRGGAPSDVQRRYVEKLWRGFHYSLGEEIEDLGRDLAFRAHTQPAARARAIEIFAARFGARHVEPTLEAVGKHVGIAGMRVSQVVHRLIKHRGPATIASPPVSRLLSQIEEHAHLSIPSLERKLGLAPGAGHSLATLKRFVDGLLVPEPALAHAIRTQAGDVMVEEHKALAVGPTSAPEHLALLRVAKRQCRAAGAANLTHLAGVVALSGKASSREDLARMIDLLPKAQWLDREQGWFVLDDLADSLIYPRVSKILGAAKGAVSIREIGEALFRDPRLTEETGGEFALAPLRILKRAMQTWPGIEETRPGWLADRSGRALSELLSDSEMKIYDVLSAHGGVAPAQTVVRLCAGSNVDSIRALLPQVCFAYSPVPGIYALRGWRLRSAQLLAALAQGANLARRKNRSQR